MAFIVIRLIYVDFRMCRTKEIVQGIKMGWATIHFQSCVVTLQWCYDMRDCSVPGKACHDRPPWALCCDREFLVAIENFLSRQRWLAQCRDRGFLCCDRILGSRGFGIAT